MSNVEILGRPRYQPIKSMIKEGRLTSLKKGEKEMTLDQSKRFDCDLIYERFEYQEEQAEVFKKNRNF